MAAQTQRTGSSGRRLALLGGGSEQIVAVEIARELGYQTVVLDDASDAPAQAVADEFVVTQIKDPMRLHADLKRCGVDGVFTHAAELAVEQALAAERFGLPGLSVDAAERGTLKHLRIRAFEESGIPVPAHRSLAVDDELAAWRAAAAELGFPLVAKPCNEKGARGVRLVRSPEELDDYFEGRASGLDSPVFLLESFEEGLQISTETVLVDGRAAWNAMALRHYDGMERFHPYLIEDGHSMELDLDRALRESIEAIILASAESIGIRNGVLKGDLLVRADNQPIVIEMAVRTSGGRFADLVTPLHCGVNILYALIAQAMGDPIDEDALRPRWQRGVSQRFLLLPEGTVAARRPRVRSRLVQPNTHAIVIQPGFLRTLRQEPVRSHHDRIGYVVCSGTDRDHADARAKALCAELLEEMT